AGPHPKIIFKIKCETTDSSVFPNALLLTATEQLGHQQATQPAAAYDAAADQHTHETAIFVAPAFFLAFLAAFRFLLAAALSEPVAEQVGQEQAAQPAATHDAAADQQAHETAIVVAPALFLAFLAAFLYL